ncbi:MAG TPA: pirin family protein [Polyangiaceae bacterium]
MTSIVLETRPLGFPWETADPFLTCVHHRDDYPAGNEKMGPAASLAGRDLGMDFAGKDGWRMYHGHTVPGFPSHPHRGFETVTLLRRGFIDHSDSLGATARFGPGDAQWLTAGSGIVHAEMFPLLDRAGPNPLELFQIWLNLPRSDKLAPPHFAMFWADDIPERTFRDAEGRTTHVTAVAGAIEGHRPPPPPPHSWAARPESDLAIWSIRMAAGAAWRVPAAVDARTVRHLYFFLGGSLHVGGHLQKTHAALRVRGDAEALLQAGPEGSEILLLQGRPIGEPVVQHGPFVMNTPDEIRQALADYRRTGFGGWPWPADDPVHGRDAARFAKHAGTGLTVEVRRLEEAYVPHLVAGHT